MMRALGDRLLFVFRVGVFAAAWCGCVWFSTERQMDVTRLEADVALHLQREKFAFDATVINAQEQNAMTKHEAWAGTLGTIVDAVLETVKGEKLERLQRPKG